MESTKEQPREPGIYVNGFAEAFSEVLQKCGVSRYKLAEYAHLDEGYLGHLLVGRRSNPSPETIVKICLALAHLSLKFDLLDAEKLFDSVGRSLRIRY